MARERKTNPVAFTGGIAFIVRGIILILDRLDIWRISDFIYTYWPLLLIALGIKILFFSDKKTKKHAMKFKRWAPYNFAESVQSDGSSRVYESKILGDISRRITARRFSGGTFFCLAGDIEIDATNMQLAKGTWVMHVDCLLGDIHIRIPENLPVLIRAQCAAGDINLKDTEGGGLFVNRQIKTENYDGAENKLLILTSVLMGDIIVV